MVSEIKGFKFLSDNMTKCAVSDLVFDEIVVLYMKSHCRLLVIHSCKVVLWFICSCAGMLVTSSSSAAAAAATMSVVGC